VITPFHDVETSKEGQVMTELPAHTAPAPTVAGEDRNEIASGLVRLLAAHETVAATALSVLSAAELAHDVATAEALRQRMREHQKAARMLRSTLES
jgi:DNA-binding ferritin-like protein